MILFFALALNILRHIPIGGTDGWDYVTVDSEAHRLYVSHGTKVVVVDTANGKVAGEIPNTEGVHGIAIDRALRRGFVSDGRTSLVTVFDLDSLKTLAEIKTTGERPDAILFDPFSSRVFTFNAAGKNSTVIDAATNAIAGTIPLGGKPEFAVSDGKGHVYVNVEDTSELAEIDAKALRVLRRWSLKPCEEPSGLAIDRARGTLISVCENEQMVFSDIKSGKVTAGAPIGKGVDGVAFDPSSQLAYASNGADGTITVVSAKDAKVIETLPTARGARTIAIDEKTHHLFLPTAKFGATPAATPEHPRPRPAIVPDTFEVLEVGR
jgi:DNA-binding beta-propeller fold protein YncE